MPLFFTKKIQKKRCKQVNNTLLNRINVYNNYFSEKTCKIQIYVLTLQSKQY